MDTSPDRFEPDTPAWRGATVLAAFRARDEGRERSPLEPLGLLGAPTPGGYVEFTADDLEALLAKAAGAP